MKNLTENKYILIGLTLIIGALIGWLIKPSSHQTISTSISDHQHENEFEEWTCSMHPNVRLKEPGSCPFCGMDLIPVQSDEESSDPMAINMSSTSMQLASIATAVVDQSSNSKSIRLTGKVMADERRHFTQSSHIPGRIENLQVNFTGEYVSKGQRLATIYSPALVTAQNELFEAQKLKATQPALYEAARKKLTFWKITDVQIEEILKNKEPIIEIPVYAEKSGYVNRKMVDLGDYIKQGASLYTISDLSSVWVLFDIYESDIQWVKKGAQIEFTVSSLPGETFSGKVVYIDPVVDPASRVAKARIEIRNPEMKLKPEMLASGVFESGSIGDEKSLTIPKSAVMWTGKRSVVYVKNTTDAGVSFRMREVTLGPAVSEGYTILDGLSGGEEIAIRGTFSIDAAAQLAGKPSMMNPEGGPVSTGHNHGGMPGGQEGKQMQNETEDHSQHQQSDHPEVNVSVENFEVSQAFKDQLKEIYDAYIPVKDALVATDPKVAASTAKNLLTSINKVDMSLVKGEAHMVWMKDLNVLQKTAEMVVSEKDVEKIRQHLSPLSDQLYQTLKKYQVETGGYRQFCPMAFDNKGAFWLSDSEEVLNPYFGDVMLTCGSVEEEMN